MPTTSVGSGDVLADRRLVELLGSGGEGEVWLAVRPDGSRCALKLVRPEVLPAADEVRRRGRWLVRIDHPSLVRVSRGGRFTGGLLAGWGFVEMDLVEGPSLQAVGPLPDALERLAGVADALDLLHAGAWSDGVPLVHRDVKPGNLIAADGGLVLVDPSTMRGLDTRELTRVGTPAYTAPEVATGRFGPLVDVYSLAATAAALLTGARGAARSRIIADPWGHDLPDAVCAALDRDPARRPGTCAAVVEGRVDAVRDITDRDVTSDPAGPGAPAGGPSWAVPALAVISLAPAVAWALRQSRPTLVADAAVVGTAVAAVAVHLLVQLAAGRAAMGLFAPPWAWGDLIAGLGSPRRRRARGAWPPDRRTTWLADTVAGTILAAVGGVAAVVIADLPPAGVPGVVAVALALIAWLRRLAGIVRRVAWAPVWTLTLPLRLLGGLPRAVVGGDR